MATTATPRRRATVPLPSLLPPPPPELVRSGGPPAAPDPDEIEHEERQKDLITFRLGARRRFWSTLFLGAALFIAVRFGVASVPLAIMAAVFGAALGVNYALAKIATSPEHYRWWYRYVFATLDVLLMSLVVSVFGWSGMVVIYFLAIVPYSFDRGTSLGYFTAGTSAVGYLSALGAYHLNHPSAPFDPEWSVVAATLLIFVSAQIVPIPARLIRRIRETRDAMNAAERGNLLVRAESKYTDELGFLQRGFNRMLAEIGRVIGAVQREADEVAPTPRNSPPRPCSSTRRVAPSPTPRSASIRISDGSAPSRRRVLGRLRMRRRPPSGCASGRKTWCPMRTGSPAGR